MKAENQAHKKLQRLLVCSLILNLMYFGLSGLFVYRRGGIPYLISKVAPSSSPTKYIDLPLYLGRKSTYAKLPSKDADVIFTGDSITDFCQWNELLQRPVLNRGIAGDTVEGLRRRIDEVIQHHPRQLFIMIGINDLMSGKTGDEVLTEYRSLIDRIRSSSPRTQIFLQSILPFNAALGGSPSRLDVVAKHILHVNKVLSSMADGRQIIYIDIYSNMADEANQLDKRYTSDGVHLNGDGYIKWRDVVRPYLDQNL
jgi:lysophospholipase L1-like esterase